MCSRKLTPFRPSFPSANAMILDQPMPLFVSLFVQIFTNLPANTDDTSSDKLLDLGPDLGVPHVLGESRRVGLSLLENGLHDRIGHNTHDLETSMLVSMGFNDRVWQNRLSHTSGSRARRSLVCSSVSFSRAAYMELKAFCCCCSISRALAPLWCSLSTSWASVQASTDLLYSRMPK